MTLNGTLPGGKELRRTDPSGACAAKIAFLGVYPAATHVKPMTVACDMLNLPADVEHESFAPGSESGREFEAHYLAALGVERRDVMVTDMLPYYVANTTRSGKRGRSMAENVRAYDAEADKANGRTTGIAARPRPAALVKLASDMKGNEDRLRQYFGDHAPTLLLTLGIEPAAFVRRMTFQDARKLGDALFYGNPVNLTFAGVDLRVVHLVHPHMFIKRIAKWTAKHRQWCAEQVECSSTRPAQAGRALLARCFEAMLGRPSQVGMGLIRPVGEPSDSPNWLDTREHEPSFGGNERQLLGRHPRSGSMRC